MDPAKYAEIFLEESREHLTAINQQLLQWEKRPEATEPVAAIFRAVHNIKGTAATMGYAAIATLAHRVENLLDIVRRGAHPASPPLIQLLFTATDALEQSVEHTAQGGEQGPEITSLLAEIDEMAEAVAPTPATSAATRKPVSPVEAHTAKAGGLVLRVALRPDTPLKAARAAIVLSRIRGLGTVSGVQPSLAEMDAESFDGRFSCRLETSVSGSDLEAQVRALGEVDSVAVVAAPEPVSQPKTETGARGIRVDQARIDRLMNLVGELVTARGRLVELSGLRADPELEDLVVTVSRLTQALQTEIIAARMTPVWQMFDRFPRLVRDVAQRLGKQVQLEVRGKEIELDRAILDELGDPLVHLLRNAVDHGIETPEDRVAAGKPPQGTIAITAAREHSTVVIRIEDDGRGINRDRVLQDAQARGLVDEEMRRLPDEGLLRILARPGFSTANAVSDVSGRGVGIDVVVTRLRALGGVLDMRSELGNGTTFTLRLPPTIAIVPALLTEVGEERYALPLTHVEETVDLDESTVTDIEGERSILLHDEIVPLVELRRLVQLGGSGPHHQPVVVVQVGSRRAGLVVDRVAGQRDIVVKTFDAPRGAVPIFSGATVLGDGRAVFILDAARLV